jgi:FkbM family methyltransferase
MSLVERIARTLVPRTIRNFLRSPGKSVRYIWERVRYRFGSMEDAVPEVGWHLKVHPAAKAHFDVFRTDPVQAAELQGFKKQCTPNMKLLDLGAHFGALSLAAVKYGGKDVRVVAVEASPPALSILMVNLNQNDTNRQIQTVGCAVGDRDGELEMLTTGPGGGDYFVVPTESRSDTVRVPQKTIQTIVSEKDFEPTHIKIDIESFEFEVIESSLEYFSSHSVVLLLEVHGDLLRKRKKAPEAIIEKLQSVGYCSFELDGDLVNLEDMKRLGFNCRLVCKK